MKKFLLLAALVAGCASWHIIAGFNPDAYNADLAIQRDGNVLTQAVTQSPKPAFNPSLYYPITADIAVAKGIYGDTSLTTDSRAQLEAILDLVNILRAADSLNQGAYSLANLSAKLNAADTALVNTELYKKRIK